MSLSILGATEWITLVGNVALINNNELMKKTNDLSSLFVDFFHSLSSSQAR